MRTIILAILPWYHTAEVEARHAHARRVLREARREREHATELRVSYTQIGRRLDERT